MSTVVQAAEHVVVESATAVVTSVVKSTAGDLKTIESSVVKEAVSATDEDVPSLLDKVEDGLQDVAEEVVKGAQAAVTAVEEHPELVAEGALAVVIGAASLIQPELAAGEIALIGKMAADSARKGVTAIATETSTNVVKAISKDLADDAKEEQAKDVADKAAREKVEAAASGKAIPVATSDGKTAVVDCVKDGANGSGIPPPDPTATSSVQLSEIQTTKVESKASVSTSHDLKLSPDVSSKDKTIAIEVAQEPSKSASNGDETASESKTNHPNAAPVSLKITLGADGEVKSVTKGSDAPQSVIAEPAVTSTTSKITSVQTTTKTAVVPTEASADKESVAQESTPVAQTVPSPDRKSESTPDAPQKVTDTSKKEEEKLKSEPTESHSATLPQNKPDTIREAPHNTDDTLKTSPSQIGSAIAMVTSTTKTKTTLDPSPEGTPAATEGSKMVTVSQESLDLLHLKLDTMHEAIQQITKVLAFHMPIPASVAPGSSAIQSAEAIINEAMATAVKPLTDLVPEIMARNDDSRHPPLEDPSSPTSSPQRPAAEKRTSVLGSIGRVLWPFGPSEKVTTVTVTEVSSHRVA